MSEVHAEEDQQRIRIRPLTRRNRGGLTYKRDASVELQIKTVLALEPALLVERARLSDHQSPDYLQEECLVYLLREYHRLGDTHVVNDLTQVLLHRCAKSIDDRLKALGADTAEDAFREVVGTLMRHILNLDTDQGDFFQVRFWVALDTLALSAFNRHVRQLKQTKNVIYLSALGRAIQQEEGDDDGSATPTADLPDPSLSVEQRTLLQEGLHTLPEPLRTAFVLRHYEDWPIEDRDPAVMTISRYFGKTSRTIQNWLRQAEEILHQWRGDNA